MANPTEPKYKVKPSFIVVVFSSLFLGLALGNVIENKAPDMTNNLRTSTRQLQNDDVIGEYVIEWNLHLGGKDFLLESPFLTAGLKQSIKDYINNNLQCDDEMDNHDVSFHSVELLHDSNAKNQIRMGRSGSGKCKGSREKCKRGLKETISDAGKNSSLIKRTFSTKNDFCETIHHSTIFDSFQKFLVTASHFNYDVDVDVINDLKGSLSLKYDVTFKPAKGNGLDQIQEIDLDVTAVRDTVTVCNTPQCNSQRSTMIEIFNHFGLPFDHNRHECSHEGINCDQSDLVTYIWIGKKYLRRFINLPN